MLIFPPISTHSQGSLHQKRGCTNSSVKNHIGSNPRNSRTRRAQLLPGGLHHNVPLDSAEVTLWLHEIPRPGRQINAEERTRNVQRRPRNGPHSPAPCSGTET